jgi:hypothetical protein
MCQSCTVQHFIRQKMFSVDHQYKISLKSVCSFTDEIHRQVDRQTQCPNMCLFCAPVQWTRHKSCIMFSSYFTYMFQSSICYIFSLKLLTHASRDPLKYFRQKVSHITNIYMFTHTDRTSDTKDHTRDAITWPGKSWGKCCRCVRRLVRSVVGSCKANWCMQGPDPPVTSLHTASSCMWSRQHNNCICCSLCRTTCHALQHTQL